MYRLAIVTALIHSQFSFAGTVDASTLLQKISAVYQGVLDYSVEVETKVVSSDRSSPATKMHYFIASSVPNQLLTEERVRTPIRYDVRLVRDGDSVWAYSRTTRRYVLEAASDERSKLMEEIRQQHFRLFRKFAELDRINAGVAIERPQTVSDEGQRIRCIVLRLTPGLEADWREQIWVDQERHLVLKSVFEKKMTFETLTTTTTWRKFRINANLDPTLFRFVRPHNAERTNQIQIP